MDVLIEGYNSRDKQKIVELLKFCSLENDLDFMIESKNKECAFVAKAGEKVVGFLCAWKSKTHSKCTYISFATHPFYRKYHIDNLLYSKLVKENVTYPIVIKIWESHYDSKQFLLEKHFVEMRRTYAPILILADELLIQVKEHLVENNEYISIVTVKDILKDEQFTEKLVRLVKDNYEFTHQDNPIENFELKVWKDMLLDCLLEDGSFVSINKKNNEIEAYTMLHYSSKEDKLEIGWVGVRDSNNLGLITTLVMHQIKFAKSNGILMLESEFDTTSESALELLKSFPFVKAPTLVTYLKEK